ncbi:MFS transporter [Legionella micdadei]|uniref:Major facilitator family transporter n=2 Tax=Legionella micdadei TaxID=451 RepID=A0A098GHB4_LEGMI|nr:MFS transporter [Legionella micdadei]ARG97170.1 MFS transporter [Legionella micdadei]KTD29230.1 major facilitator superfamily (MFS) transporter [Legionella micdadei]NSL17397.1 MFS transporter [Legionella micdadei]CEG61385.1 Major facilitator family transporter [Legionella micdadei]SCY39601.1 Predicted arabinose efflux permease, MFS family [Legionella micdadei]
MISNLRIAWLLSYISIASFSAAIVTPALPFIQIQFGLGMGQVEWMVSSFLIGYVIGQLIYGPIANRWGRVYALRIGLCINLIGILLCLLGLALSAYWLIIIGRLVSALGAASGLSCTFMLINEWLVENQRKTAMSYTILSFTIGIGMAVTIGGLIAEYWNWTYCFLFLLVHGLLMLWGTQVFNETLEEQQPIHFKDIIHTYKQALSSRILVLYALVVGFCSIIGYCFSAAGPQIANEVLHISAAKYGYWNLLNMMGMLLGGLWAKVLLNRFIAVQVVRVGLSGCALGITSILIMMYSNSTSPAWFFINTSVLYLFGGLLFAGGSFIASNALADKASCSSMMSFINMSTAALAVMIMGYLGKSPLQAFVEMLTGAWLVIVGLLLFNVLVMEKRTLLMRA